MDFEHPFLTFTNLSSEANYLGEQAELEALHRRTDALDYALRTGKEFDVVLDMLEEDGQDASAYVDSVESEINLIIASHQIPDDLAFWQSMY